MSKREYHYFTSFTKSGKYLAQSGEKKEVIRFIKTWIEESPYYDPKDTIFVEEITLDENGMISKSKIIKEY